MQRIAAYLRSWNLSLFQSFVPYFSKTMSVCDDGNMFQKEKERWLNMPLEEKKNLIAKPLKSLDEIPTWEKYWTGNKSFICANASNKGAKAGIEVARKISLWLGDITTLEVDVIVNAANSFLRSGGGVDGAIHKAAGPTLKLECATLGMCPTGESRISGGYMLPAKYIIHTVGPQGEVPEKLKQCYTNSLELAKKYELRTIAFPCISTGIYGYPQKAAAKVALSTTIDYLLNNMDSVDRVIFCLFLNSDKEIYEELLASYFNLE